MHRAGGLGSGRRRGGRSPSSWAATAVALLWLGLLGCEGGEPGMCTNVRCNPPPCCGNPCGSSAECCTGTVCSTTGRCIPEGCTVCGEVGCQIDYDACTFECSSPSRCLNDCASDADCAPGTRCSDASGGGRKCFPDACDACGGLTPSCHTQSDCSSECRPPETCGDDCASDADCGGSSVCHTFTSTGQRLCVPMAFSTLCGACPSGCTFRPSSCEVVCQEPDAGSSTPRDSGPVVREDAGPRPPPMSGADAGEVSPPAPEPTCQACCQPCESDADCCPSMVCAERLDSGQKQCLPAECGRCGYGCRFRCP